MTSENDEDDVGYGKPPKGTQFKKGKSGNPKGRPRGHRNFATDLDEILSQSMTITENGKRRKVTCQLAMLKSVSAKALQGDLRALMQLLNLALQRSAEKASRSAERELSDSETDILNRHKEEILRSCSQRDVSDDE